MNMYNKTSNKTGITKYIMSLVLIVVMSTVFSCPSPTNPKKGAKDDGSNLGGAILESTNTYDLSTQTIDSFDVVNDGESNSAGILVVGTDIYVVELEKGKTAAHTAENDISTIPYNTTNSVSGANFLADINAVLGGGTTANSGNVVVFTNDMTKKVYVKIHNNLLQVNKNAAGKLSLSVVDLSAVKGQKIEFDAGIGLQGKFGKSAIKTLTWAKEENRLYVSATLSTTGLESIIAWIDGPFNGAKITSYRGTAFYFSSGKKDGKVAPASAGGDGKGAAASTNAPIATLSYAYIKGVGYLAGVNTCSPGFSIATSEVRSKTSSTGTKNTLSLIEGFNMVANNYGQAQDRIFHNTDGGNTYLFTLTRAADSTFKYEKELYRVGEKYTDGSLNTNAAKNAANADVLDGVGTTEEYTSVLDRGAFVSADAYGDGKIIYVNNDASVLTTKDI